MEMQVFQTNPKLRTLLLILIFNFAASGIALAILAQIQAYNREQIYLATEAALPRHRDASKVGNSPSTALGTTLNEVEGWKTYRNEELGFEFRYPADWEDPSEDLLSTTVNIDFQNSFSLQFGVFYNQNLGRGMTIDELVRNSFEEIIVDGKKARKISEYGSAKVSNDITVYIPVDKENIVVVVNQNKGVDEKIFNQILSTFKFIK